MGDEAPTRDVGLVAAVDARNVEALERVEAVGREEACKGHGEVVAQREQRAALVLEVVDELAALVAVLAHERCLVLKHGRLDLARAVALEDGAQDRKHALAHLHLLGQKVARALGNGRDAPLALRERQLVHYTAHEVARAKERGEESGRGRGSCGCLEWEQRAQAHPQSKSATRKAERVREWGCS
jgi:hypothetical protein